MSDLYPPLDERGQPAFYFERYGSSTRRAPKRPRYQLPRTVSELTGPVLSENDVVEGENNLYENADGTRAIGSPINVAGRLLDGSGKPLPHSLVELWQANSAGKYDHALDGRDVPIDPNFSGCGRCVTDKDGKFFFTTIMPGAYPVPGTNNWWRPPHIHFSLFGPCFMTRLITQMFFPGHHLNEIDAILHSLSDRRAADRLIATANPDIGEFEHSLGYEFDIVLRGPNETPMVD